MKNIISTPNNQSRSVDYANEGSEYYETVGRRSNQEDALAIIHELDNEHLTKLSPDELGKRLWSAHCQIDTEIQAKKMTDGATASTTLYDGKGALITATIADAASFVAIYDKQGNPLGVLRLNSRTHKPSDEDEKQRIEQAGAMVFNYRGVDRVLSEGGGGLAVSRALGDHDFNKQGDVITADSTIDVTNLDEVYQQLSISKDAVGRVQIINTCDGFTDGADQKKLVGRDGHAQYLLEKLKTKPDNKLLGKHLADEAISDGSRDNVSIAIQTIVQDGQPQTAPVMVGVYDGHGGSQTASYAANHIGPAFNKIIALEPSAYAKYEHSADKHPERYKENIRKAQGLDTSSELTSAVCTEKPEIINDSDNPEPSHKEENLSPEPINSKDRMELLQSSGFNKHLQALKEKKSELEERNNERSKQAVKVLDTMIATFEDAKNEYCTSNGNASLFNKPELFSEKNMVVIARHRGLGRIVEGFLNAVNSILSVFSLPKISIPKTNTLKKVGLFKEAVDKIEKDELNPEGKPQNGTR